LEEVDALLKKLLEWTHISYQLSVISYQLSVIRFELSDLSFQFTDDCLAIKE
jgi:hypothetical protein